MKAQKWELVDQEVSLDKDLERFGVKNHTHGTSTTHRMRVASGWIYRCIFGPNISTVFVPFPSTDIEPDPLHLFEGVDEELSDKPS